MFCHSNGKHYLVFRIELYGYSILEVETRKEMHYVPTCVHPEEGEYVEEVFIWTSADYDSGSNLLAVTGCIWAVSYTHLEKWKMDTKITVFLAAGNMIQT